MGLSTTLFFQADHPLFQMHVKLIHREMADDTRDSDTVITTAPAPVPPKKFPKGVVLGKDGKP